MKFSVAATTFIALGVAAFLGSIPARAQDTTMHMKIPFEFVAGDRVVPAGAYRVTVDQTFHRVLFFGNEGTSLQIARLTPATDRRPAGKEVLGTLRFARYGGQYFLVNVWRPGQEEGNRVMTSKRLIEAASGGNATPTTVSVTTPN